MLEVPQGVLEVPHGQGAGGSDDPPQPTRVNVTYQRGGQGEQSGPTASSVSFGAEPHPAAFILMGVNTFCTKEWEKTVMLQQGSAVGEAGGASRPRYSPCLEAVKIGYARSRIIIIILAYSRGWYLGIRPP